MLGFASIPVSAQTTATESITAIVDEIESTGRFIDPAALPLGEGVEAAIDRANAAGLAVAIPDPATNAEALAPALNDAMIENESRYTAIFVMTPLFIAAEVDGISDIELNEAFDASDAGYLVSGDAGAIDGFVASINGGELPSTADSAAGADGAASTNPETDANAPTNTAPSNTAPANETSSGGGFPWIWAIVASIAGFFGIRYFSNKRKRTAAEQAAIEVDRDEIAEQLRNNADRVIDLGDPVIASRNPELIAMYEEASTTYQEVSIALPEAKTAIEIDALDDRIDNAEWQLEVIAARLADQPEPPSPAERERAATPPAPTGPALGPDDSIFGPRSGGSSTGSRLPRSEPAPPQRRSSSGMGGGMGGMLGSILGSILMGSGRPRTVSRRTQRRTGSSSSGPFGSSNGSSGSFPDPFSKTRRSSGRSLGGSGSSHSGSRRASGSRARTTSGRSSSGRSRSGRGASGSRRR